MLAKSKISYLYHGSTNKDLSVLEPQQKSIRHPDEGPVIFATDSEAEASKFIVPCNDTWSQLSCFGDTQVAIYSDFNRFVTADKGGAIYKLNIIDFKIDSQFTQSSREYTSRVSVTPISKKVFNSGLTAMLEYGIKVYFVTPDQLLEIHNAPDHGWSIIQTIQFYKNN